MDSSDFKPTLVVLNASSRPDGNTATLLGWIAAGCRAAGAEVDWIDLANFRVRACIDCRHCDSLEQCPIDDDLPLIMNRLRRAHGVVIGTPVRTGEPARPLAALLERVGRIDPAGDWFSEHWSLGVTVSGKSRARRLARQIASFFGQRSGTIAVSVSMIHRGSYALLRGEDHRLQARARRAGAALVEDIRAGPSNSLSELRHLWTRLARRRLAQEDAAEIGGLR